MIDVLEVSLDGIRTDMQFPRDFVVCLVFCDEPCDFLLPRGQVQREVILWANGTRVDLNGGHALVEGAQLLGAVAWFATRMPEQRAPDSLEDEQREDARQDTEREEGNRIRISWTNRAIEAISTENFGPGWWPRRRTTEAVQELGLDSP